MSKKENVLFSPDLDLQPEPCNEALDGPASTKTATLRLVSTVTAQTGLVEKDELGKVAIAIDRDNQIQPSLEAVARTLEHVFSRILADYPEYSFQARIHHEMSSLNDASGRNAECAIRVVLSDLPDFFDVDLFFRAVAAGFSNDPVELDRLAPDLANSATTQQFRSVLQSALRLAKRQGRTTNQEQYPKEVDILWSSGGERDGRVLTRIAKPRKLAANSAKKQPGLKPRDVASFVGQVVGFVHTPLIIFVRSGEKIVTMTWTSDVIDYDRAFEWYEQADPSNLSPQTYEFQIVAAGQRGKNKLADFAIIHAELFDATKPAEVLEELTP